MAVDGCRIDRHHTCNRMPVEQAGVDHGALDDGQCGFQSGHAHGCYDPLALFGFGGVWRMIGTNGVNRAIG